MDLKHMKHIKLFREGFNKEDYYIEIDHDEWDEFEPIEMSDSTINKINKSSPFLFEVHSGWLEYRYDEEKRTSSGKTFPSDIRFIIIYEGDDEYFYVYTSNNYYKCDQLEGLKILLNKIYLNDETY